MALLLLLLASSLRSAWAEYRSWRDFVITDRTCFYSEGNPIIYGNCRCHPTCKSCGYYDYPDMPDTPLDCITCMDETAEVFPTEEHSVSGSCHAWHDRGCYDENRHEILGCTCHITCGSCGFSSSPTGRNDCIRCRDGSMPTKVYWDKTGYCEDNGLNDPVDLNLNSQCKEIPGFERYNQAACVGRDELGTFDLDDWNCMRKCQEMDNCVSFETYRYSNSDHPKNCRLSTTCLKPHIVKMQHHCVYTKGKQYDTQCARPWQWCRDYDGIKAHYSLEDCDGDGIKDPVCKDDLGNIGVVQSRYGCKDSWPNGACWKGELEMSWSSEPHCRHNAWLAGFEIGGLGYPFAGNWSIVGCYAHTTGAYAGHAYYGYGVESGRTRADGDDVIGGGVVRIPMTRTLGFGTECGYECGHKNGRCPFCATENGYKAGRCCKPGGSSGDWLKNEFGCVNSLVNFAIGFNAADGFKDKWVCT